MKNAYWIGTATLVLSTLALAPVGSAHPFALPINGANGNRCYYYDDHDTNSREFWIETNGVLTGGVPLAEEHFLPPTGGSGLQRTSTLVNGVVVPADTRVNVEDIVVFCSE